LIPREHLLARALLRPWPELAGRERSTRWLIVQTAAAGLGVVVLLGAIAVVVFHRESRVQALTNAKRITRVFGEGVAAPYVTPGLLGGDRRAVGTMDWAVRRHMKGAGIARVKVWDSGGRIVYSDAHALIGRRFTLEDAERKVLRSGHGVAADVSDAANPEHLADTALRGRTLQEVYVPLRGPGGRHMLFEAYLPASAVTSDTNRLLRAFLPGLLAALLLLWITQVPVAWSLGRRLRERQRERAELLQTAIEASDLERRRIARDLHDGAVQNLVAVAYALAAEDAHETTGAGGGMLTVSRPDAIVRETIKELRTLLVEIHPPNLHQLGLAAALHDLMAPVAARGLKTDLDVPEALPLPKQIESLLFRVAQEAVRNAVAHAHAGRIAVRVCADGGRATLTVSDDGIGFLVDHAFDGAPDGHLGLRLVAGLVEEAGGTLDLTSSPGSGTRVAVEVPLP
jgi:two-component system NarL family sensor kinase